MPAVFIPDIFSVALISECVRKDLLNTEGYNQDDPVRPEIHIYSLNGQDVVEVSPPCQDRLRVEMERKPPL